MVSLLLQGVRFSGRFYIYRRFGLVFDTELRRLEPWKNGGLQRLGWSVV